MAARRKTPTAAQNKAINEAIARGEGVEDKEKMIEALKRSLNRGGNLPVKNARIRERLKKLGA